MNVTLFERREVTLPVRDVTIPDVWAALESLVGVIDHDDPRHNAIVVCWHTAAALKQKLLVIENLVERNRVGNLSDGQVIELLEIP